MPGIEGISAGHDVIKKDFAIEYLKNRGQDAAILNSAWLGETKLHQRAAGSSPRLPCAKLNIAITNVTIDLGMTGTPFIVKPVERDLFIAERRAARNQRKRHHSDRKSLARPRHSH